MRRKLVKIGMGISVLATWIAQEELKKGTLVALPLGPLPGRDELLARGVKVTVKAGKTAKAVVAAP